MMSTRKKIADHAILFRLYCERSPELVQVFSAGLSKALELLLTSVDNVWKHPQKEIQVRTLDQYLDDTLIIEIVWNAAEEDYFWQEAIEKIHAAIDKMRVECQKPFIRGMTFILQACSNPKVALDSIQCDEILKGEGLSYRHPRLSQRIRGGRIWLLKIPDDDQKEFVYLALCTQDREADLADELNDMKIIKKDLTAHKAFQCGRSYRRIMVKNDLDTFIGKLTDSTEDVVDEVDVLAVEQDDRLTKFARDYVKLLKVSLALEMHKTSLAQQQWNYKLLVGEKSLKVIDEFLSQRINGFHQEATLKCEQCRRLLDGAEKAADIAQTRIDKVMEKRLQRREFWFAFLGIALAVPQLFSFETIEKLLLEWGIIASSLIILLFQVHLTILLSTTFSFLIWIFGISLRRWRKGQLQQ